MPNLINRYKKEEDGATAVEFALISVGFITIVMAIVEMSFAVWTINSLDYAVAKAGRHASINSGATTNEIETIVNQELEEHYIPSETTSYNITNVTRGGVNFVDITATMNYEPKSTAIIPGTWSFSITRTTVNPVYP